MSGVSIGQLRLAFGRHDEGSAEMCVMEAVAHFSGESWTDRPASASPVISALLRSWNDGIEDQDRPILTELIPLLPGTAGSLEVEARRSDMALDWHCRVNTAAWLRAAHLSAEADRLEEATMVERSHLEPVESALQAARALAADLRSSLRDSAEESAGLAAGLVPPAESGTAWAAAWDAWLASNIASSQVAAVAAAGTSAWDSEHWASHGIGRDAVGQDLIRLARSAARDAAWVVACSAAWSVAWTSNQETAAGRTTSWETVYAMAEDAATSALRPTVQTLQASFLRLIKLLADLRSTG